MDPIEKAIRSALEKGDSDDPEFRERVYQAVRGALDRAIQANPQLTVERAIARRKSLQEKIAEIESEFAPALPPEDPVKIDERLDEALLDILAQSPMARQTAQGGQMAQWPTTETTRPGQSPDVARPSVAPQRPAAPPAPESRIQPEPPRVRLEPSVEPPMRGEPFVRTPPTSRMEPGFGSPGNVMVPPPDQSPFPVDPPLSVPSTRADASRSPAVQTPAPTVAAIGASTPEAAPYVVDTAPLVDLGVLPEVAGRPEADLDFPGVMPPGLDRPDISAPAPAAPPEIAAADRKARSRERRRPYAALFFGVALLSLAAVGLMFAFQTGLLKSPEERDTSVHNPPAELPAEDFSPGGEQTPTLGDQPTAAQDWLKVFAATDPSTASAPGDTKADAMLDEGGAFLRIRSGASGAAVAFDVGQDVLERLAGKTAIFNVTARAEDGKETEISIECNFGELGDCGRKRYIVGYERAEYLFEVSLPNKRPGANGTIAINSDFSGQGKAIDVYEIRAAAQ